MGGSLLSTIRNLHQRRGRDRRGLTLAEGVRLVEEAMAAGVSITAAVTSPSLEGTERGLALKAALEQRGVRLEPVDDRTLAGLASTEHPQGVVAVVEPRSWQLADLRFPPAGGTIVVLDALQDPGNVGTIARTALGLGAVGLVALKGTAELANPKVQRAGMGALFRLPAVATDEAALLAWAEAERIHLWVADQGGAPAGPRPAGSRLALVLGNEGAGVRPELAARAERTVAVALAPAVESLNVAVAAGILLHEVNRDR